MAQITLNSTGVASNGALVLQSNGTTTAVTISTGQVATFANDAVVNGLTVGRGAGAAASNTVVGASALTANTTGIENGAFGGNALQVNTTGNSNNAFGRFSLSANTTGGNNTAMGHATLTSNTTASNNTALGYQAGFSNTTGATNTAVGQNALYTNSTGSDNTAVGRLALQTATGSGNTAVGENAGNGITTGAKNTLIGRYNGNQSSLDLRTASNNIVLSDGDGVPRMFVNYIGQAAVGGTTSSVSGGGQRTTFNSGAAALGGMVFAGTSTTDTYVPINQISGGGTMLMIASRHTSDGTSTTSAVYMVQFYYNGDNTPAVTTISGTDFLSFGATGSTGSKTLTVTNSGGGQTNIAWFFNK